MNLFATLFLITLCTASAKECNIVCPSEDAEMECGLHLKSRSYIMFPSKCALAAYSECYNVECLITTDRGTASVEIYDLAFEEVKLREYVQTPLSYCIKSQSPTRRMYGESCPVFCPNHYRPVCGASKFRSYVYRTFNNGCYLDMINCRGDDDFSGFVEVPLENCPNHAMKNIFKEQVVVSNWRDYHEY